MTIVPGLKAEMKSFSDVGMFAPMVGSLAKEDSEIGARMGICFAFNSQSFLPNYLRTLLKITSYKGFGGLIGMFSTAPRLIVNSNCT